MKTELYRLHKSYTLLILFIILFLSTGAFATVYRKFVNEDISWVAYIEEYNNISEIPSAIEAIEQREAALDVSSEHYESNKEALHQAKLIYNYLYINEIPYKDVITDPGYLPSKTSFSYFSIFCCFAQYLAFMFILLFCLNIINTDFNKEIIDKIYGGYKNRYKIMLGKFGTVSLCSFVFLIIIVLCGLILKERYAFEYDYVLFFNNTKITMLSIKECYLIMIASLLVKYVFYLLCICSISMLSKKSLITLLASLFILSFVIIFPVFVSDNYSWLFANAICIYSYNFPLAGYYVFESIKILLLIGIFLLCIRKFNKIDLV